MENSQTGWNILKGTQVTLCKEKPTKETSGAGQVALYNILIEKGQLENSKGRCMAKLFNMTVKSLKKAKAQVKSKDRKKTWR